MGDGRDLLWTQSLDFLPVVIKNIGLEGGRGVFLAPN